jgi:heparanase
MKRMTQIITAIQSVILLFILLSMSGNPSKGPESNLFRLDLAGMKPVGEVDERYQSFNVEMCEVIGGDFWIPYKLIDSVRKISNRTGLDALKWTIPPINLYEKKIRMLASALGPVYFRVSGTWANAIYFQDNDEPELSNPPTGYNNVLTRKVWKGVVDFCKAIDARLVTSFAICDGMRDKNGNWTPAQVEPMLKFTKSIGGEIAAAELFNEPSHASHGNAPAGYNGSNYAKDFAAFKSYVRSAAPEMKILGPGSTGEGGILPMGINITVDKILSADPKPVFDIFSYHYYGDVSQRCGGRQSKDKALSNEWLSKTEIGFNFYKDARDQYLPGIPIWLTETAESACGGNPLAATYTDTFRYLEQLGRLAKKGVQVVMHNTLATSEYALLEQDTHKPRPNYWAALLWSRLMGTKVYDAGIITQGVDIFAHNLKNSSKGIAVLIVNTKDSEVSIEIPAKADQYMMTADELQSKQVRLNGTELGLTKDDELPVIKGKSIKAGEVQLPPQSILFLSFRNI